MTYQVSPENEICAPVQNLRGIFMRVAAVDFRNRILNICCEQPRFDRDLFVHPNYDGYDCWSSQDGSRGFAVGRDRELTNVFSCIPKVGGGDDVMRFATSHYDSLHLNCYEGKLESFYAQYGFQTYRREENWYGNGHAGVVYMRWER